MIFPTIKFDYKTIIVTALIGAAAVWFAKKAIKEVLPDVAEAINPVSQNNIFFRGFNSVYSAVTGSPDTVGEDIADLFYK